MNKTIIGRTKRELEMLSGDLVEEFELEAYDFEEEHVRAVLGMISEMAGYSLEYEDQLHEYITRLEKEAGVEDVQMWEEIIRERQNETEIEIINRQHKQNS